MKNNLRSNLQEKFGRKRGKFKPETQQILKRLEKDDNNSLQISCKLIKTVDRSAGIGEQLNQIQSGSETPIKIKNGKELKPISATDRLGPKITQPIILQSQGTAPEKTKIWMNYEPIYPRCEIKVV